MCKKRDSPVEYEYLLLLPGVGDPHVGDHDPVDVGGGAVQLDAHLQRGAGLHGQLVVDQVILGGGGERGQKLLFVL